MKRLTISLIFSSTFLLLSGQSNAELIANGVLVTPTKYAVQLKAIDFVQQGGEITHFHSGDSEFDLAAVDAGAQAGQYGEGNNLIPGTYTGMRFTIGRTMNVIASGTDDQGQACHTATGLGTTTYNGMTVSLGSTNPDVATTAENINIPNNENINEELQNEDDLETLSNGNLRGIASFANGSVTINQNETNPQMKLEFGVVNAVEIKAINQGQCIIIPNAPTISAAKI